MFKRKKYAVNDFTIDALPSTRFESFLDIIRNQWTTILSIGLVLFVSIIPIILNILLSNVSIVEIETEYVQNLITLDSYNQRMFQIHVQKNIIFIPLSIVFSIGLAGSFEIIKKLIWQEPIFFINDFIRGIKLNVYSFILHMSSLFFFVFIFQFLYALINFTVFSNNLILAISLVVMIIYFPITLFSMTQTILYDLPLFKKINNSLLFTIKTFLAHVLLAGVFLAPWLLLLIQNQIVFIVSLTLLFIIIFPLQLIALIEYHFSLYDEVINKDNFIDIYKKGIWTHAKNNIK